MSYFDMVRKFHEKFSLPVSGNGTPRIVEDEVFQFRLQFLLEEVSELLSAHRACSIVEVADSLADLIYVACGTAHLYGIPLDEVFTEVHRSNMRKERASGDSDFRSKRSSWLDVVKPEGWTPPNIAGVLGINQTNGGSK